MIKLLILLLTLLLLAAGGSYFYEYEKNKKLTQSAAQIELEKQAIESSLNIEKLKNTRLSQQLNFAEEATVKAIQELNKAKKPIVTPVVNDAKIVASEVKKYYNDDTVKFIGNHFEIAEITTYKLISDAISWKINYPILQDEIDKSGKVIVALQMEEKSKDELMIGLQNANKLQMDALANNQQVIDNIRKSLIVEEEQSKIKKALYCAGGLVAGYFVGKSIK